MIDQQIDLQWDYTPGPWDYDMDYIVAPDPSGLHPDIYIAEIAHDDEEGRIASVPQQDANRKLIAAAPELFEAIQALLVARRYNDHHYDEVAERAISAITKAKGRD